MADAKGAYIGGVPVQFKDAAARAMISDEYNSAETYAKGNLCIYNGKIYEAIKETTGIWDATAWEETTLAKVNSKLNGDIAGLTEKSTGVVKLLNGAATAFGGTNQVGKKGKLVTLDLALSLDDATTTMYQLLSVGQLPAGFEPAFPVTSQAITRAQGFYFIEVNTSGTIGVQPFDAKASSLNTCLLHLAWIAKN